MKKTLIVFYSRTGITKKIGELIAKKIGGDVEELIDEKDRSGPLGYVMAGKDAALKKLTEIKPLKNNPEDYKTIILGTPIWAYTMAPALRTYIEKNKTILKKKATAFFCTQESSGGEKTLKEMETILGKPVAELELSKKDIEPINENKLKEFLDNIKK